jgi:predicted dithiol-disulfide oxidoreductase (DUF899 family)
MTPNDRSKTTHRNASREEWLRARRELLAREKAHTHTGDELARARRALPWVRMDKPYRFEGPSGTVSLADLFQGRSQLIVQHFMFAANWSEGCASCSMMTDHVDGALPHLEHRDVTFTAISSAPFAKLAAFRERMGWKFPWVSSNGTDFNRDFGVSFTEQQLTDGPLDYNFATQPPNVEELQGISVFAKDGDGSVFHTYSTYGRGAEAVMGIYKWLDMVPKGRDEDELAFSMAWVRHHDRYDRAYSVDAKIGYVPPRETVTRGPA